MEVKTYQSRKREN